MTKKRNCIACETAENEPFTIMQYKESDLKLILQMEEGKMKLKLTDGGRFVKKSIYHCPFCGSEFEDS